MVPLENPSAEVCSVAKKDLKSGDGLDAIGEYAYRAWIMSPEDTVSFAQATSALNATGLGSQAGVESFEHTLNFMKTAKTK